MKNNFDHSNIGLTIGAFALAAGVHVETVRFYQRKGLLAQPDKPLGSVRRYGEADVARVRFVKSAQQVGFSLDDIAELLQLHDGTQCAQARTLAAHKLTDIRQKLTNLTRMESALSSLVVQCDASSGQIECPLITALQT